MYSLWAQITQDSMGILAGPFPRPRQFQVEKGLLLDLSDYTDEQMFDLGLYKWDPQNESYDPRYQIQLAPQLIISRGTVTATYVNVFRNIEELLEIRIREINEYRDAWGSGGWIFRGMRYDSDNTARQNLSGTMTLVNTGYQLPNEFTWRSHDNTDVPFTTDGFREFFTASCLWAEMVYRVSWMHKAQVQRITDPQTLLNYDITAYWPPGYTPLQLS